MNVARLHTRTLVEVPVIIERAKKEGPCLLLTAGIHGDEMNGIEIVRQLVSKKYNKPTNGMVICIPVVNIFGFINQSRYLPDGRDLNRVFPGSKNGSLASRFADALMSEIVPHIDYCIDYHTGGASRFNYSQLRINGNDSKSKKMSEIFGAKFVMHAQNREKSFREAAAKLGKTVLLFEGGKANHLDRTVTEVGITGALRIMQHLGMRDFSKELIDRPVPDTQVYIKQSSWVRAKFSGMYRSMARLGAYVEKGAVLGTLSDPFGEFEKVVRAPHEGYIINSNHAPVVNQGDALIHLAQEAKG